MSLLTFRPSRTGDLVAAYLGACRVGYAQRGSKLRGWVWNLSLVRPEGGLYAGREPELEGAQRALEACAAAWVLAAGLSANGWAREVAGLKPAPTETGKLVCPECETLVEGRPEECPHCGMNEPHRFREFATAKKKVPRKSKKAVASSEI